MRFLDYPPQEPLSGAARTYHEEVLRRSVGITGEQHSYGTDPYQRLTIFRAIHPDGRVLVVYHGGGWTNGYQEWMHFMAPALNARGITLVSAGYRLAPEHLFPEMLDDCHQALAWIQVHSDITDGGAGQIFIGGHSAGGHLASLLALCGQGPGRSCIAGCLPVSGVYRFGAQSGLKMRPRFLGPASSPAVDDKASPQCNIGTFVPPFFLAYGEHDFPHLRQQALDMASALRNVGGTVRTLELPDCDHFSASYAAGIPDGMWVVAADEFMRQCMGLERPSS